MNDTLDRTTANPPASDRGLPNLHTPARTSTPYNILMIAPTMFFASYGAHVRILEEATSLRDMGHRITILAYPNGQDIAGLNVERCWGVPFNYRVIVGSSRHKFYLDAMLGLKSLSAMPRIKPDIIHAHLHEGALIGSVLSKLWRVPLIFDFQGSLTCEMIDHHFIQESGTAHRFFRWLEERIDQFPDAVITSSHNAAHLLETEFHRTRGDVYTIADCVNPDTFRPDAVTPEEKAALKEQYGIPADARVVLYLGILQDYQGIPQLIHAAKHVIEQRPDTYFLILGFPNLPRYQAMTRDVGVSSHVRLPGPVPHEETPKYHAIADIAAAPKLSSTEGAAKLLYYMATARPIVAYDTPVSREYLGELGMCSEPGSVEGLAADILALLDDPEAARKRGEALRARAIEHYSWAKGGERITEIYRKVCPHPRGVL